MSAVMDAASIRETAARWLVRRERGLSAAEQVEFLDWQSADPAHVAAVAQLESTWGALDRPMQAGAEDAVLQRLDSFARRRRRRRRIGTAVAALMLLGGAGYLWQVRVPAMNSRPSPVARVLLPEKRTLPDGSVAELKEGAQLALDFTPEARRVTLQRGEAHFQVTKNPARPFIVAAAGVEVQAVGTAFSVQLGPRTVEVLVTEGRVAVQEGPASPTQPASAPSATVPPTRALAPFVLDAGHGATIELARAAADRSPVAPVAPEELDERLAWRSPRLEFTGVPLAQAVALMNQHSGTPGHPAVRVVIDDPAVLQEEVSGLFRADKIDTFVRVLENGFGLKAEPRGEHEIVLRRAH